MEGIAQKDKTHKQKYHCNKRYNGFHLLLYRPPWLSALLRSPKKVFAAVRHVYFFSGFEEVLLSTISFLLCTCPLTTSMSS